MAKDTIAGSFGLLFLYDICEEIRLDELRGLLKAPAARREPSFRHPVPEYVRFERPPVVDILEPVKLDSGEVLSCRMNYYEYGVVTVKLELPFEFGWDQLVELSGTWIAAPAIEGRAAEIVRSRLQNLGSALVKPYDYRLTEDYYVIQLKPVAEDGRILGAGELIASHRNEIAQIVRGELLPLSNEERTEVLQSYLSYYPNDLLVVGWTAALIYDTPDGASPTIQLLEYANTQLLEFRHYDHVLTRVLADVYASLSRRPNFLRRWRLAGEAERLNTIRLDVRELTERVDNSIKFLSDMFAARVYRLASGRIGVPDYRKLVEEKLKTGGELYGFMMDEFHQARAFVLELMIVIILIIDLFFLFRGKT